MAGGGDGGFSLGHVNKHAACETHTTAVCLEYTDRGTNQGRWEVFGEESLKKSSERRETGFYYSEIELDFFLSFSLWQVER